MRLKTVIYKVSINSDNIFSLRKEPEELKRMVFEKFSLQSDNLYTSTKYAYAVQIIQIYNFNGRKCILSRLIKYLEIKQREKWDAENHDILNVTEDFDIVEKVHFIYDETTEYIFLEERSQLDIEIFKKAIEYIINFNNCNFDISLNPIRDDETKEKILKLKKIIWAHFEIIPNNPGGRMWNVFEEIGEELNSTTSTYEFKNENNGLTYSNKMDTLVSEVNEGRGRQYIVAGYKDNGEYDEIRSHDHIKRFYTDTATSDEGRINGLWEIVKDILDL